MQKKTPDKFSLREASKLCDIRSGVSVYRTSVTAVSKRLNALSCFSGKDAILILYMYRKIIGASPERRYDRHRSNSYVSNRKICKKYQLNCSLCSTVKTISYSSYVEKSKSRLTEVWRCAADHLTKLIHERNVAHDQISPERRYYLSLVHCLWATNSSPHCLWVGQPYLSLYNHNNQFLSLYPVILVAYLTQLQQYIDLWLCFIFMLAFMLDKSTLHTRAKSDVNSNSTKNTFKTLFKINSQTCRLTFCHRQQFGSLARSAKLPTGLYILLVLIYFFFISFNDFVYMYTLKCTIDYCLL